MALQNSLVLGLCGEIVLFLAIYPALVTQCSYIMLERRFTGEPLVEPSLCGQLGLLARASGSPQPS